MYSTVVGYAGGTTSDPTYQRVCAGGTGHVEVVQVVYDPSIISTEALLNEFWDGHRPVVEGELDSTSFDANRDGRSDQYRSIVLTTTDEQLEVALERRDQLDAELGPRRWLATQIDRLTKFHYAEDYHQQYSAKRTRRFTCS